MPQLHFSGPAYDGARGRGVDFRVFLYSLLFESWGKLRRKARSGKLATLPGLRTDLRPSPVTLRSGALSGQKHVIKSEH